MVVCWGCACLLSIVAVYALKTVLNNANCGKHHNLWLRTHKPLTGYQTCRRDYAGKCTATANVACLCPAAGRGNAYQAQMKHKARPAPRSMENQSSLPCSGWHTYRVCSFLRRCPVHRAWYGFPRRAWEPEATLARTYSSSFPHAGVSRSHADGWSQPNNKLAPNLLKISLKWQHSRFSLKTPPPSTSGAL